MDCAMLSACSRGCKRMTERRKLRCRESSRICSRLKIAIQKVEDKMFI